MKEALRGIKFYEVIVRGVVYDGSIIIATYRNKDDVNTVYAGIKAQKKIVDFTVYGVSFKEISSSREWFPIFVPELRKEYSNLNEMAEDIMAYRLSGLMDGEL